MPCRYIHTTYGYSFCYVATTYKHAMHMKKKTFYTRVKKIINNSLQWHHNEHNGVSNQQRPNCLLHCLFRHRSKKTSKLCVTGPCEGNPPVTGGFPSQRACNTENVSIWWHHHVIMQLVSLLFWPSFCMNHSSVSCPCSALDWSHCLVTDWCVESNKKRGPSLNIKMSSYQYRKSHRGDKTVIRSMS